MTVVTRLERESELEAPPIQIASGQKWTIYRMRDNSPVVEYFHGKFRNRMLCMTCNQAGSSYFPVGRD